MHTLTETGKRSNRVHRSKKNKLDIFHPDSLLVVVGSDSWGKASRCCDTRSSKVRPESTNSIKDWSRWGRLLLSRLPLSSLNRSRRYICRAKKFLFLRRRAKTFIHLAPKKRLHPVMGWEVQGGGSLSHLSQSICCRKVTPDPQCREKRRGSDTHTQIFRFRNVFYADFIQDLGKILWTRLQHIQCMHHNRVFFL